MSISFIVPTKGRDTLGRTITSIEKWTDDEILVEVDNPPSNRWGNDQRNDAMKRAKGKYLAFIDDDDWFVLGHREIMDKAIKENPGKPILFRIKYPDGNILWKDKNTEAGNVSTQMILVPNLSEFITEWEFGRNMADQIFISKWPKDKIVWRPEIICLMGHDYE